MVNSSAAFGTLEHNAQAVAWQTRSPSPCRRPCRATALTASRCGSPIGMAARPPISPSPGQLQRHRRHPICLGEPCRGHGGLAHGRFLRHVPLASTSRSTASGRPTTFTCQQRLSDVWHALVTISLPAIPKHQPAQPLHCTLVEDLDPGAGGTIRYRLFAPRPTAIGGPMADFRLRLPDLPP